MAITVETINAQGELVEVADPTPAAPDPQAAPPREAPPAESAPASDGSAAPPSEAPSAESAPAPVSTGEDDDSRDVPRGVQKRFDTLTRQREEARRDAQAMREQMAHLQGQLESLTRVQQGGESPQPVPLHQQPEPRAEDYASQEEWFKATRDWDKAQLKAELVREQQQQAAHAQALAAAEALHARQEALQAQHGDYYDRIAQLRPVLTPVVEGALLHHELGPDLAYYLAQHPEEARRLQPLPPLSVWRELSKLEARLESNGAVPRTPAVVSSSTPKPAPLTPVGSSGAGAPMPSLDDPQLSQREWEAAAERQYPGMFSRRR